MSPLPRPDSDECGPLPAATVTVYPHGRLVLRGSFEVREVDGTVVTTSRIVALCRCGRSALKPLCDGSHKHRSTAGRVTAATRSGAGDYDTPTSSPAAGNGAAYSDVRPAS